MSYHTFFGAFAVLCATTVIVTAAWITAPAAWRFLKTANQRWFEWQLNRHLIRHLGQKFVDHFGSTQGAFDHLERLRREDEHTDELIRRGMRELERHADFCLSGDRQ